MYHKVEARADWRHGGSQHRRALGGGLPAPIPAHSRLRRAVVHAHSYQQPQPAASSPSKEQQDGVGWMRLQCARFALLTGAFCGVMVSVMP
jgi:hypothetical protein